MSSQAEGISLIRLERTECYGPCPVYEVELGRDGRATYVGKMCVEKLGVHTGWLDEDQFERLARLIVRLGFFDLDSDYSEEFMDAATHITTVVRDGVAKRVSNYGEAGPDELWAIEELIDAVADGVDWEPGVREDEENE